MFAYSVSMPPHLRPIYTREYVNQLRRLTPEVMAIVEALVDRLLLEQGMILTNGNWLKPLGDGLWEFRIGQSFKSALRAAGASDLSGIRSRRILIRVFFAFDKDSVVLLGCYNKLKSGGERPQNIAINKAKDLLLTYKREK